MARMDPRGGASTAGPDDAAPTAVAGRARSIGRRLLDWPYTFAVALALSVGVLTMVVAHNLDLTLRDPDGFLGPSYIRLPALGLLFVAGGITIVAIIRSRSLRIGGQVKKIIREEWTWNRLFHVALGLITFYICYISYRNLKGYLPLVREGVEYDTELTNLDRLLFFGNYPSLVLQDALGTSVAAQVLSTFYISYLVLVPISLAALLVWSRDISLGAWYATALSLNWVLGVASYYALPTVGPAFINNALFFELPLNTGVAELQRQLFRGRVGFLQNPFEGGINGIAGFASLHVSVVVTACLFLQRTAAHRVVRVIAWAFLPITVLATIYFGWHYIADDVAGVAIGWVAVVIGAKVTGNTKKQRHPSEADGIPTAV